MPGFVSSPRGAAKLVILRLGRSCQPMLNAPSLGKNCSSL
jgi:hypothetical protein